MTEYVIFYILLTFLNYIYVERIWVVILTNLLKPIDFDSEIGQIA